MAGRKIPDPSQGPLKVWGTLFRSVRTVQMQWIWLLRPGTAGMWTQVSFREEPLLAVKLSVPSLSDVPDKEPLAFTSTVTLHSLLLPSMPRCTPRCPLIRPATGTVMDSHSSPPPPHPEPPHSSPPFIYPSSLSQHSFHLPHHFVWTPLTSYVFGKTENSCCSISSFTSVYMCVCVTWNMPTHWHRASPNSLEGLVHPKYKKSTYFHLPLGISCQG